MTQLQSLKINHSLHPTSKPQIEFMKEMEPDGSYTFRLVITDQNYSQGIAPILVELYVTSKQEPQLQGEDFT